MQRDMGTPGTWQVLGVLEQGLVCGPCVPPSWSSFVTDGDRRLSNLLSSTFSQEIERSIFLERANKRQYNLITFSSALLIEVGYATTICRLFLSTHKTWI